jgi:hypothetical protein
VGVSPGRKSEEGPGEVAGEKKTRTLAAFWEGKFSVVVNEEGGYDKIDMVKATACSTIQKVGYHSVGQREAECYYCEDVLKTRSWEVMIWLPT